MDLKLAVHGPDSVEDLLVSLDGSATVSDVADLLRRMSPRGLPSGPVTLAVSSRGDWRPLPPTVGVIEAGVVSGQSVCVVDAQSVPAPRGAGEPVAVLKVLNGPDAGTEHQLAAGATVLGRSIECDVQLRDPLVSKRHAVVHVGDRIEIVDLNSSNGIDIDGLPAARATLDSETVVLLGDTQVSVRMRRDRGGAGVCSRVDFNRPPLLQPVYSGVEEELPEAPGREGRAPLPVLSLIMPILLGGVFYLVTRQAMAVLFIALSPLLMLASFAENWYAGRRAFRRAADAFRARLNDLRQRMAAELRTEEVTRLAENPAAADCLRAVQDLAPLLWSRSPGRPRFLQLRLGLATRPSRSRYPAPSARTGDPALRAEAEAIAASSGMVPRVPVVADLADDGVLGVCGTGRYDVARGLLIQLLALHAPGELRLAALVSSAAVQEWSWLRWVPHTIGAGPLGRLTLAADSQACATVVAKLEQLVEDRLAVRQAGAPVAAGSASGPAIVVLADDGAAVERGRLLAAVARGHDVGVHLICTADRLADLPAACRHYLDLSARPVHSARLETGEAVDDIDTEPVTASIAETFARTLAPVTDAAAMADGQSELPRSAAFLEQPGARDLVGPGQAIAERWREGGSLGSAEPRRKPGTLRALVGVGQGAPFHLDLREQGPHALVGGTTGSGKSEFLQSWILGMALAHSPKRVTFLLVDYKGGSAFADCMDLPHTVGLVTDLTPRLVSRALTSLKAELRYRERLLNQAGVPDLLAMEKAGCPETPPSLVIAVDEFAALVQEVPDFVDGIIDVAQRGRSLGLHLVLATQRPAGVIKDNLRANTNLRVALRMADEEDSVNVIGSDQAALFAPDLPGRAVAKMGPGRTTAFQALYVGGRTPDTPPPPMIGLTPLRFGALVPWQPPEDGASAVPEAGPTDIQRLVSAVASAAKELALPEPRKPWLPVLARTAELADLPTERQDAELVFGVVDVPDWQARATATYRPDSDGTMVIVGTGGSGKSTTLRTLALAAGATSVTGGRVCQVYGIDFGARGLASLETLPHVGAVIGGDDHERIIRLLNRLRALVEDRAVRYSSVQAGTVEQYRVLAGQPEEARMVLLIDNFPAFRQAYETGPNARAFETLQMLAQDGRTVGVHVVVTADRLGAIPSALAASVQKRLVLRLAQENDLAMAGLRADAFGDDTPPGRGYLDGLETQVAVLGASTDPAEQAERVKRMADVMRQHGVPPAAPVERLPDRVPLTELPATCDERPALGIGDDTMAPTGFDDTGPFLLAGPPQSGRTTVLATLVQSLCRAHPGLARVHVGRRRSPVTAIAGWSATACTEDEVVELAQAWMDRVSAGERFVVVVEGIPDYLGTLAESYLQDLVTACGRAGNCVIAEGDTSQLGSSWPLLQAVKSARHGLILQPDQSDGDALLRTPFPRLSRAEFPPGRGLYVRSGRFAKVQVALPD
jgi:S-DNA-T family DNA segregation ATPase FtsK/SpoIIIE